MEAIFRFLSRHPRRLFLAACAATLFALWFGLWLRVLPVRPRANFTFPAQFEPKDISADGRLLAATARERPAQDGVHVYDLATGKLKRRVHPESLLCVWPHFSPNGQWLLATVHTPGEHRWRTFVHDLNKDNEVFTTFRTSPLPTSPFSPDSRYVVIPRGDAGTEVYATTSGERLFAVAGQTYHPFFSFSNDSQSLAYFARDERRTSLSLFDLERREQVTEIDGDCWGAAFSPDGKVLAATKAKPESDATNPAVEVLLIELPTGKQRAVEARLRSISNLLFSEGGRKLIGLDCPSPRSQIDSLTEMNLAEETSKIVSFDPLKAEATVDTWAPWARPSVTVNQFSPTTLERSRVYDILRGEWCAEFDDGPAFDLARITLDGRFLAWPCHVEKGEDRLGDWLKRKFAPSGNEPVRNTRALRIIDLEMGRTVLLVAGTDEFRFSADGRTLVTWTWDREARVWDLPPRRPIFLLALLAAAPTLLFTVLLWWRLGRA